MPTVRRAWRPRGGKTVQYRQQHRGAASCGCPPPPASWVTSRTQLAGLERREGMASIGDVQARLLANWRDLSGAALADALSGEYG